MDTLVFVIPYLKRNSMRLVRTATLGSLCAVILAIALLPASAQFSFQPKPTGPWMNTSLSPDERADLVIREMTLDEKIALLHGVGMPTDDAVTPENAPSNRGVGYA